MSQEIFKVPTYLVHCDDWDNLAQNATPDYGFLGRFIQQHAQEEKIHGTALAYAVYLGGRYWSKSSPEVGKPFGYDYDAWARHWSGKRDISPYERVGELMYQMRTGVIQVPNEVVLLNDRGEEVTEVNEETGEKVPVKIRPDVFGPDVEYTKLLLSKSKAQNTGLTKEDWGKLLNPEVTVEQFRQHLLEGEGYGWSDNPGRFRCFLEGFMILCSEGGRIVEYVGEGGLNIEGLELGDPILRKTHAKVCRVLGLEDIFSGDF